MPDQGQLFLSHSSGDREIAEALATRLRAHGVDVWLDVWQDSTPFIDAIEQAMRTASAVAILIGAGGLGPYQRVERDAAIVQSLKRGLRVIPVLLPNASLGPTMDSILATFPWVDMRAGLDPVSVERLAARNRRMAGFEKPLELAEVLMRAQHRLIISGHTLDKFTGRLDIQEALTHLIRNDVRVSVIQLNPVSAYARAHQPYHELESTSSAVDQHHRTLEWFVSVFRILEPWQRDHLDVVFANYMPRFRTIVVDDAVHLYLYMYGSDVGVTPDVSFVEDGDREVDSCRRRIIFSVLQQLSAPEAVPFIRCGQIFPYWARTRLASWDSLSKVERDRHRITHAFYVSYAGKFHDRFGSHLETEVRAHLNLTKGRTLVIGCGSGKEVQYVLGGRPNDSVIGLDFSPIAIGKARRDHGNMDRFLLGDFYDLEVTELAGVDGFETVIANAAFVHLGMRTDLQRLLVTTFRLLKEGGVLFVRCLHKVRGGQPVEEELDESAEHLADWGARRWFVYYSRQELADSCRRAGFVVDDSATDTIARRELRANARQRQEILEKGFPHALFKGVFWPTVLARKPFVSELAAQGRS